MKSMNFDVKVEAFSDGGVTRDSTVSTFKNIYKGFWGKNNLNIKFNCVFVFLISNCWFYRR